MKNINNRIKIRGLSDLDCVIISSAFTEQGWNKRVDQYKQYYDEQQANKRVVLIAEYDGTFAGYLTIKWESTYEPLRLKGIPEIVDLNVLIKYRKNGIATALMNEAERLVMEKSNVIGIGFGLTSDYGAAQKLYIKRGYVPDGLGISQSGKFLGYGDQVTVDDNLALYLTKRLK